jgi:hypothetical protein
MKPVKKYKSRQPHSLLTKTPLLEGLEEWLHAFLLREGRVPISGKKTYFSRTKWFLNTQHILHMQ